MTESITFWLSLAALLCWPVCFWWMHRISERQEALLRELAEQSRHIEELSREEHDLIEEVHPKVGEIHDEINQVKAAVNEKQLDEKRPDASSEQ
jgi:cell division protein FtsB